MSGPARRHDAGDIPTRCPSGDSLNLAGIRGSPPPSRAEARWGLASRDGPAKRPALFESHSIYILLFDHI
jgi:hypothetical protein